MKKIPPLTAFVISVVALTSVAAYQPAQIDSASLFASDDLPPYIGKDSIPDTQTYNPELWLIASDDLPPYIGKDSIRV